MMNTLNAESKRVGLEINYSKTKVMTNSSKNPITIGDEHIEYVNQYPYLGKQISFDPKSNEKEIERRTKTTWNKYWSQKETLKSDLPTQLKKKVMDMCILPTLTYACQTWKFSTKAKRLIVTCQRGMERSMMKIKKIQKIKHSKIRRETKVIDALSQAQKLKWKWAGHVARLQDERWSSEVTTWKGPEGKRRRGRPLARWADDVVEIAGPNWVWKAQDRNKWQSLEEAFTS